MFIDIARLVKKSQTTNLFIFVCKKFDKIVIAHLNHKLIFLSEYKPKKNLNTLFVECKDKNIHESTLITTKTVGKKKRSNQNF